MSTILDGAEDYRHITGEIPPNSSELFAHCNEDFANKAEEWAQKLPSSHEAVTTIDGKELPVSNLIVRAGEKAHRFGVIFKEEVDDHKPEIVITVLTAAGVFAAISAMRPRPRK